MYMFTQKEDSETLFTKIQWYIQKNNFNTNLSSKQTTNMNIYNLRVNTSILRLNIQLL